MDNVISDLAIFMACIDMSVIGIVYKHAITENFDGLMHAVWAFGVALYIGLGGYSGHAPLKGAETGVRFLARSFWMQSKVFV